MYLPISLQCRCSNICIFDIVSIIVLELMYFSSCSMRRHLSLKRHLISTTRKIPLMYGVWDAMQIATFKKEAIVSICGKELKKLIAVANPTNDVGFMKEVS